MQILKESYFYYLEVVTIQLSNNIISFIVKLWSKLSKRPKE